MKSKAVVNMFEKPNHHCFWCGWYNWKHGIGGWICEVCFPEGDPPRTWEQQKAHIIANRCPEAPKYELNFLRGYDDK